MLGASKSSRYFVTMCCWVFIITEHAHFKGRYSFYFSLLHIICNQQPEMCVTLSENTPVIPTSTSDVLSQHKWRAS